MQLTCPECEKKGKKNKRLYPHMNPTFINNSNPEMINGVMHLHNSNEFHTDFNCDEGHTFKLTQKIACHCEVK